MLIIRKTIKGVILLNKNESALLKLEKLDDIKVETYADEDSLWSK